MFRGFTVWCFFVFHAMIFVIFVIFGFHGFHAVSTAIQKISTANSTHFQAPPIFAFSCFRAIGEVLDFS